METGRRLDRSLIVCTRITQSLVMDCGIIDFPSVLLYTVL